MATHKVETPSGENVVQNSIIRRVVTAGAVGSALEWYDFYIYGTAAALVFNQLFFPNVSPILGTLAAFATYGVGFFARPVGGIVFSNYGDKLGRKSILVITLLLMGVATTLMGLLPTYGAIGIWAPILLVTLRLLQGFGAGAELGGANTMVSEYSSSGRRGFNTGWIFFGVVAGLMAGASIFAGISALLPEEQFLAWGWRIPFLLSIVIVAVGMYIRLRIAESPVFTEIQEGQSQAEVPVKEVVRSEPKGLLIVMGGRMAENGLLYLYSVFLLAYISQQLNLPNVTGLIGLIIASFLALATIPFFATLSDRIGRHPVLVGGAAFSALSAFPIFWLINTESSILIWLGLVFGLSLAWGSMVGTQGVYFTELFPARLRYSGYTVGREVSSVFAGGLSPFIATALLAWSGGEAWPVATYAAALSLIALVALYLGPETYQKDISK